MEFVFAESCICRRGGIGFRFAGGGIAEAAQPAHFLNGGECVSLNRRNNADRCGLLNIFLFADKGFPSGNRFHQQQMAGVHLLFAELEADINIIFLIGILRVENISEVSGRKTAERTEFARYITAQMRSSHDGVRSQLAPGQVMILEF